MEVVWQRATDISNLNKIKSIFKENLLTLGVNSAVRVANALGFLEQSEPQTLASHSPADLQALPFLQPRQCLRVTWGGWGTSMVSALLGSRQAGSRQCSEQVITLIFVSSNLSARFHF